MKTLWTFVLASMFAVEAVPQNLLDPLGKLSAVGILGLVILVLLWKTIPSLGRDLRKAIDDTRRTQHEDQQQLTETLRELQRFCASRGPHKP